MGIQEGEHDCLNMTVRILLSYDGSVAIELSHSQNVRQLPMTGLWHLVGSVTETSCCLRTCWWQPEPWQAWQRARPPSPWR